ncbi:hypothetical protein [Streptomyces albidoflavus]|nr:hypothetical protein [Streptomyces albidoflavus]
MTTREDRVTGREGGMREREPHDVVLPDDLRRRLSGRTPRTPHLG